MTPSPDPENFSWLRFILATTTVVGLMGLFAWGLKRFASHGWRTPIPGTLRRLKIIETLPLDARRRLVIVQCDNAHHLLLLGLHQDLIVASNLPASSFSPNVENYTSPSP